MDSQSFFFSLYGALVISRISCENPKKITFLYMNTFYIMPLKYTRRLATTTAERCVYIKRCIEVVLKRTFTRTLYRGKSPCYNILMAQGKLFVIEESTPKRFSTVLPVTRRNPAVNINQYILFIVFGDLKRIMYNNIVCCYYWTT